MQLERRRCRLCWLDRQKSLVVSVTGVHHVHTFIKSELGWTGLSLSLVHYAGGNLSDADMMEIGDTLSHAELVGFVHCRALRQIVRVQICKYFFQDIMHQ